MTKNQLSSTGHDKPYDLSMKTIVVAKLILAFLILCCGSLAAGRTIAQDPPENAGYQLHTTLNQLLGEQIASRYQTILPADQPISWEVYAPKNDSGEKPGVFVYVSPRNSGQMDSRWRAVMDQQNLIYIAANDSGNRVPVARRMVLAVMAVHTLAQKHSFDSDHIMISGFSGGGRVASKLATQYPELFTGALYICGVDFWKKDQTPKVERLVQNRFVFLTGSRDFNKNETKQIYRRYLKAGAQYSKLMVIPGLEHEHPDANALTEALEFLKGQDQS
jgi:predicted esterase